MPTPLTAHFTAIDPRTGAPATLCGKPVGFRTLAEAEAHCAGANYARGLNGLPLLFAHPV
jgi:hypothetical protein